MSPKKVRHWCVILSQHRLVSDFERKLITNINLHLRRKLWVNGSEAELHVTISANLLAYGNGNTTKSLGSSLRTRERNRASDDTFLAVGEFPEIQHNNGIRLATGLSCGSSGPIFCTDRERAQVCAGVPTPQNVDGDRNIYTPTQCQTHNGSSTGGMLSWYRHGGIFEP